MPKIVPYSIFTRPQKRDNACVLYAISNLFNHDITSMPVDVDALNYAGNYVENSILNSIGSPVYTESIMRDTMVVNDDETGGDMSFLRLSRVLINLFVDQETNEETNSGIWFLGVIIKRDDGFTVESFVMHRILVIIKNGYFYLVDSNQKYIIEGDTERFVKIIKELYFGVCDVSSFHFMNNYKTAMFNEKLLSHIIDAKEFDELLN